MLNVKGDNPFTSPWEGYDDMRHDPPKRKGSANIHPEDIKE